MANIDVCRIERSKAEKKELPKGAQLKGNHRCVLPVSKVCLGHSFGNQVGQPERQYSTAGDTDNGR